MIEEKEASVRGKAGQGLLLVVSGPSGVGKTTIARRIQSRLDGVFSISATTRPRSDQEVDGRDYWFVDQDRFDELVARGELLEHATVFGKHSYGTPREPVEEHLAARHLVVLDIDVQGGLQVRRAMPEAFMMFILPPSEDELLHRLRGRGREDEAVIQRRFAEAKREIATARESGAYDEFVTNDDLERAIREAIDLVERRRE